MALTMSEQVLGMRLLYPGFQVKFDGGWHVRWEGELRPFSKRYLVRIAYSLKSRIEGMEIPAGVPDIWLADPSLRLGTPKAPGMRVPHIYYNEAKPEWSRLCLFDPVAAEWTPTLSLADTIIPWTIDWLASYEGWLATGEWTGGGRGH